MEATLPVIMKIRGILHPKPLASAKAPAVYLCKSPANCGAL